MPETIRALKAKKAEHIEAAATLNAITNRELTAEEQAALDGHMDKAAALTKRIEQAELLANEEAGLRADGGVQIAAAARLSVADNAAADPRRGFAHAGEFFKALISVPMGEGSARPGYALGGKLHFGQMQAAAPGTFGGEGVGADGGFAFGGQRTIDALELQAVRHDGREEQRQATGRQRVQHVVEVGRGARNRAGLDGERVLVGAFEGDGLDAFAFGGDAPGWHVGLVDRPGATGVDAPARGRQGHKARGNRVDDLCGGQRHAPYFLRDGAWWGWGLSAAAASAAAASAAAASAAGASIVASALGRSPS